MILINSVQDDNDTNKTMLHSKSEICRQLNILVEVILIVLERYFNVQNSF